MTGLAFDEDALIAAVDLVGRSGATGFECGYLDDDVPTEEARWWAKAQYRGARIQVDELRSPVEAAEALARRILTGGHCAHCGALTVLDDQLQFEPVCRWTRTGRRWERGCIDRFPEPAQNRAQRRQEARRQRRRGRRP